MTNWKPTPITEDIRMWIVCTAIGADHNLMERMVKNKDGEYSVFFSVGGVELNFDNVAKRIEECLDDAVTKKAQELLNEKFNDLIDELCDMKDRVKKRRDLFKYDWED